MIEQFSLAGRVQFPQCLLWRVEEDNMPSGDNPKSRKNLVVPSSEVARKNGAKGGRAKARNEKARKTLREELLVLLSDGDTQERMSLAILEQAMNGNTKAYEIIRDTIGEKPMETIKADVDVDTEYKKSIANIKAIMRGKDEEA